MHSFERLNRLPPYVFSVVNDLMFTARRNGEDIINLGMGNPDQPTPAHIVEKLNEASQKGVNHRYSASKGIAKLRLAVCDWYERKFSVTLDPNTEAVATIGSKEGLAHLALAVSGPGDTILCSTPAYPIHPYAFVIAGAQVIHVHLFPQESFLQRIAEAYRNTHPKPKFLVLNYPNNPTTATVGLEFFEEAVAFAKANDIYIIHDLAYGDLGFNGYQAPSILQIPGAKDVAVEFSTLSKSYNMAGWRVGFCVGNREIVGALVKIKSYLDYGMFQAIQIAAIAALNGPQECVEEIRATYESRRNVLVEGLNKIGWRTEAPQASMFVWSQLPEPLHALGSLEAAKRLVAGAKVAVSPGIGFGDAGEGFVRFALIENEERIRQAVRGIRSVLTSAEGGR
ncbi:MAG: aminotransferase class I/II-fold pyridoxal phosphate-dependent enzyme [Bacteroidetes bacterium]|nr:aminotransferase class I/II-fold pyridoxal phosphate-dependent enzyme [Bacteroidota bacterium]